MPLSSPNRSRAAARRVIVIAPLALTCLLAACAARRDPLAPAPEPEPNPAEPTFYACGQWYPEPPPAEVVVLDLELVGEDPYGGLKAVGAEILHAYHVRKARARLRISALPGLQRGPHVALAEWVAPTAALEFRGVIVLRAAFGPELRAALEALGVRDIRTSLNPWVSGTIPDASVPAILALPEVSVVELNHSICLADDPARLESRAAGREAATSSYR